MLYAKNVFEYCSNTFEFQESYLWETYSISSIIHFLT